MRSARLPLRHALGVAVALHEARELHRCQLRFGGDPPTGEDAGVVVPRDLPGVGADCSRHDPVEFLSGFRQAGSRSFDPFALVPYLLGELLLRAGGNVELRIGQRVRVGLRELRELVGCPSCGGQCSALHPRHERFGEVVAERHRLVEGQEQGEALVGPKPDVLAAGVELDLRRGVVAGDGYVHVGLLRCVERLMVSPCYRWGRTVTGGIGLVSRRCGVLAPRPSFLHGLLGHAEFVADLGVGESRSSPTVDGEFEGGVDLVPEHPQVYAAVRIGFGASAGNGPDHAPGGGHELLVGPWGTLR